MMMVKLDQYRQRGDLQLPPTLHQDVESYAQVHGILPAEALRYLVLAGLEAEARAMVEGCPQ